MPAETYNVADLSVTPSPTPQNIDDFRAAAVILAKIFKAKDIPYAFVGGFALSLLGHSRIPKDVDCVVVGAIPHVRDALATEDGCVDPSSERVCEGLTCSPG